MHPSPSKLTARVLIVDDDPVCRSVLSVVLQRLDYQVLIAASVEEARTQLEANPDVLLLDAALPDGCGLDLLQEIRERQVPLPVALITATPCQELPFRRSACFDAYFHKPLQVREILEWLRVATSLQQMGRSLVG